MKTVPIQENCIYTSKLYLYKKTVPMQANCTCISKLYGLKGSDPIPLKGTNVFLQALRVSRITVSLSGNNSSLNKFCSSLSLIKLLYNSDTYTKLIRLRPNKYNIDLAEAIALVTA